MKTKLYTHKRQGGRYRIHFVAKGSGTLNTTSDDAFVVYHNELGQHFVRPLAEFGEAMNEVKKPLEAEAWQGNWPESADERMIPIMQNGNDGKVYDDIARQNETENKVVK